MSTELQQPKLQDPTPSNRAAGGFKKVWHAWDNGDRFVEFVAVVDTVVYHISGG